MMERTNTVSQFSCFRFLVEKSRTSMVVPSTKPSATRQVNTFIFGQSTLTPQLECQRSSETPVVPESSNVTSSNSSYITSPFLRQRC